MTTTQARTERIYALATFLNVSPLVIRLALHDAARDGRTPAFGSHLRPVPSHRYAR